MKNKCAIVTGGSRHIGRGIAVALAKHGYDIAITYATSPSGAKDTKEQIEALGRRCFVYEAHLEQPEAPAAAVNSARADLGRLDVMVCNAGKDARHSVLTVTAEDLDHLYKNNIRNYFLCAGAASRVMVKDKTPGSIIMVTSVRANLAHPDDFYYGGLKAAMERACKSMALDLCPYGIRVNCVAPGAIWKPDKDGNYPETPFIKESIPLKRTGYTGDIGEAAVFLVGDGLAYITGTTILVDGGLSLPGLWEQNDAIPWDEARRRQKTYEKAMEMLEK
jgi:NAD(P)-dependent dehydrogenase (short-subunit alcohol dehydrogenase family)